MAASRNANGITTIYLGGNYEVDYETGTSRTIYTLGGDVVAQRTVASGVHTKVWLHTDHLGGVSAATSSTGTVLSQQRYKPWGEIRSGDVPETTLDFTGQRRDGSGLLYYHARYCDSGLAKFISPDTIVPGASGGSIGPDGSVAAAGLTVSLVEDAFAGAVAEEHRGFLATGFFDAEAKPRTGPSNPQALNRYSYVLNGPVRWVDPSGHWVLYAQTNVGIGFGIGGTLSEGVAWDGQRVMHYGQVEGGGVAPWSLTGGASGGWSSGGTVDDFGGLGEAIGGSGGPLGYVGVDVGHGTDQSGSDTLSVSLGGGISPDGFPGEFHGGKTNTWEIKDWWRSVTTDLIIRGIEKIRGD